MPATQPRSPIRWSTGSQREAAAALLKMTERAVAVLKRETAGMLSRAELHLRAWSVALDPTTAEWVAVARKTKPKNTPDESRAELQARLVEVRRRSQGFVGCLATRLSGWRRWVSTIPAAALRRPFGRLRLP